MRHEEEITSPVLLLSQVQDSYLGFGAGDKGGGGGDEIAAYPGIAVKSPSWRQAGDVQIC